MTSKLDLNAVPAAVDGAGSLIRQAEERATGGEWAEARRLFCLAVKRLPSPPVLIAYGVFLADCDELDEAVAALERAWTEACRQNEAALRAICCANLAILARRRGDTLLARQFHQLALSAVMESAEFQEQGRLDPVLMREAAAIFVEDGEIEAAGRMLSAARGLADGGAVDGAETGGDRAVLLARQERTGEAVQTLMDSIGWRSPASGGERRACDLSNLGHLLQSIGRLKEAAWCFRAAAGLFERAGAAVRRNMAVRFAREAQRRAALRVTNPLDN